MNKTVKGYIVEEYATMEQINETKALYQNVLDKKEFADLEKTDTFIATLLDYINNTNSPYWFDHVGRIKYNDAKYELLKLKQNLPDRTFRLCKANIVVNEHNIRQSYSIIPW